jgi:hypothetical protein
MTDLESAKAAHPSNFERPEPTIDQKLDILVERIEKLTDAVNSIGVMQDNMSGSVVQFFNSMQSNPMLNKLMGKFGGM